MTTLALLWAVGTLPSQLPTLFRIQVGGRYGFVDRHGRTVVPPTLRSAGRFREGLAWFSRDGRRYGYLGPGGKVAVPPRFTFAADFSEGLAAASDRPLKNGWATYGFIDRTGRFQIPQRFRACEPDPGDGPLPLGYVPENPEGSSGIEAAWFQGGRARLEFKRWIGKNGKSLPPPPKIRNNLGPLHEGLRSYFYDVSYDGSSQLWYVRAVDGKTAPVGIFHVPPSSDRKPHERLNFFSEGRAPTWSFRRDGSVLFGYIGTNGNLHVAPSFEEIRPFRGGLAEVVRDGRTEYIDRNGKRVWPR